MRRDDLEDLDDMIAELENSLGVNTSEYLDDYLDTVGLDSGDAEGEVDELGADFEEDFDLDDFAELDENFDVEDDKLSQDDFDDDFNADGAADED